MQVAERELGGRWKSKGLNILDECLKTFGFK